MAEERGLVVDFEGFNSSMEEARERSRSAQNKVAFVLCDNNALGMVMVLSSKNVPRIWTS